MSLTIIIAVISGYFLLLMTIARLTTRNADAATFYTANKQSPWYLVAFGMVGATLSGVTFISLPGEVGNSQFSYFQMVLGYLPGYLVVGAILLPLYYRLKLITIYTYLEKRFGFWSHKAGAFYFLLSRVIGAAFRLFLVAGVLQLAIFNALGVPFWITVVIAIALIWLYTFQGGIKTIVFTDTLQTLFMLSSVIISIVLISGQLNLSFGEVVTTVQESDYSQVFFWDSSKNNFFKQFFAGVFMVIVMTGLDQDMMQKNLTCRNLKEAQRNMFWFSIVLVFVNILFLCLGALLFIFAIEKGIAIPERTDDLFPTLALNNFSLTAGIFFLLGLTAAAYSSADSALTSLTTTFCVDFLKIKPGERKDEKKIRLLVHFGFSVLLFLVILLFRLINDESVISGVFTAAGYTYGPLLGLFAFGLFTKMSIRDKWVPWVCLVSPILSYLFNLKALDWFGYQFGFEILIVNGVITFLGLLLLKTSNSN